MKNETVAFLRAQVRKHSLIPHLPEVFWVRSVLWSEDVGISKQREVRKGGLDLSDTRVPEDRLREEKSSNQLQLQM